MDGKPLHYDGSMQNEIAIHGDSMVSETVVITDEIRSIIGGNPYEI